MEQFPRLDPAVIVLVVMLVAAHFVDRPWCRYACPLGAASGLVGAFSPVRIERMADACTSCGICTRACPMGLAVATAYRGTPRIFVPTRLTKDWRRGESNPRPQVLYRQIYILSQVV